MAAIDSLPREILQLTFLKSGDNLQEQAKVLCKIGLVCKSWQEASSCDLVWRPLLKDLCPRGWERLCDQSVGNTFSIKRIFANVVRQAVHRDIPAKLHIALEKLDCTSLNSLFHGNTLHKLSLIHSDATLFIENLINNSEFSMALFFILQDIFIDSEIIFEKLLLVNAYDLGYKELSYSLVLKHFLHQGIGFSQIFDRLDNEHSFQLKYILRIMSVHQSLSILDFVRAGLSPNFLFSVSPFPEEKRKLPLVYFFVKSFFVDAEESSERYEMAMKMEAQWNLQPLRETYLNIELTAKPITQEALLTDFQAFLKWEGFEINAKNIRGGTILSAVRQMKGSNLGEYIFLIEKSLVENGAI